VRWERWREGHRIDDPQRCTFDPASLLCKGTSISTLLARGGKIVMHTGWVDPILPAPDVINY
jgi:hypothetical protein